VEQRLRSATLAEGTSVRYAEAGAGPPLLFVGGWLSHLELSWALPAEREFFEALARGRTLIRYDRVGCGLSDRPAGWPRSLDGEIETIAAVVAAGRFGRFDVVASSLGVPVAIEWASRHPETVDRLVLYGGWARGAEVGTPEVRDHVIGLISSHWGLGADVLTDIFAPDASAGTRAALANYQRQASSAETAAGLLRLCYAIDVTESLPLVQAPTLVVHRQGDRAAPVEQAERIAGAIAGARLTVLPGRSHLPHIGDVEALVRTIRSFLGLPPVSRRLGPELTGRQQQVAALVSDGLTNRQVGERLGITERSAEGHVERIRVRLGVRSRAQIAAWWVATQAGGG
jgi:pimeloyl-ACP methyl ester carboxylesterase/DNA-binding CsgD family transcriptional regulator